MKRVAITIGKCALFVVFLPLILLVLVLMLLYLPEDYAEYKRSHYYKDLRIKYHFLGGSSKEVVLYNVIKEHDLPIEHIRYEDIDYFRYRDTLLLYYTSPVFDGEQNIWTIEIEDEYIGIEQNMVEELEEFGKRIGEGICTKAIALVDRGEIYSRRDGENAENCSFMLLYHGEDNIATVLRAFIEQYP